MEALDKIFAILGRIIEIPMHQYARYFERYRQMAQTRPVAELAPSEMLTAFRAEVDGAAAGIPPGSKSEFEIERDLRLRIDTYHLEIFSRTQTETTKRWTYESEIKRPYFHVTELDEGQLSNWKKYLDFEEAEGSYSRIQFLYERCLVTCAHYDEFWLRYSRWMLAQEGKEEEVRNIYQRASTIYVPISRPEIRLQYAYFEEMTGRVDVAKDIHSAILVSLPDHIETIISQAKLSRRHGGLDAAIEVYKYQLDNALCDMQAKAALVAEWAKLLWKIKGSPEEARQVFQKNQHWYPDSRPFWTSYLMFELEQPTSAETESTQYQRIKHVIEEIRSKSTLPLQAVKELIQVYMAYLLERGSTDSAKEYMALDRQVNGPQSLQTTIKLSDPTKDDSTGKQTPVTAQNGQIPQQTTPVPYAAVPQAENPYKYYQQPVDRPISAGGSVSPSNYYPYSGSL